MTEGIANPAPNTKVLVSTRPCAALALCAHAGDSPNVRIPHGGVRASTTAGWPMSLRDRADCAADGLPHGAVAPNITPMNGKTAPLADRTPPGADQTPRLASHACRTPLLGSHGRRGGWR